MSNFLIIFPYLRIILFGLIILVAVVYSIPIVFLRRFHYRNNMLTLNICVVTTLCCLYWFLFYVMLDHDLTGTYGFLLNNCIFVSIFPVLLTLEVPMSFVTASVNRLCAVVYQQQPFFTKKYWIPICILAQWIFGTLLTLPILLGTGQNCQNEQWTAIYKLFIIVVIPAFIFLVVNVIIFISVRSSSRRVAQPLSVTENQLSNTPARKFSRRDLHLLRHMVVMIAVFVGGWAPLYTLLTTQSQFDIDPVLSASFTIWCELALLCDIIDLYLYNHELRNYLKSLVFGCCIR